MASPSPRTTTVTRRYTPLHYGLLPPTTTATHVNASQPAPPTRAPPLPPPAPSRTGRAFHSMIAFEGRVYACCGKDRENNLLNSVEAYDPAQNAWFPVAPTRHQRRAMQVIAC